MMSRGKGPLFGWRGSLEETTDTIDIGAFLKTDGPTTAQELADLMQAIAEGGTFGDYRRVEGEDGDRVNFFVYGPNSILFMKKRDVPILVQAIEALGIAETPNSEQMQGAE